MALVGVPWEATTSYGRGTAQAPQAIAEASVQVDLYDVDIARLGIEEPTALGIHMLPPDEVLASKSAEASAAAREVIAAHEAGTPDRAREALAKTNALSAWMDDWLYRLVREQLDARRLVGTIGGDHSVAFAAIEAHAERYPGMGVLHIDAHADLRASYQGFVGSHASVMHRVLHEVPGVSRIVSIGLRDLCKEEHDVIISSGDRVVTYFDTDVASWAGGQQPFQALANDLIDKLPRDVYVSFDIDGLDPSLCPHTGTPVPGGLSFREANTLLHTLVSKSRRIVGFDLCEVAPGPEGDEWDANVGARVLFKLAGYMLATWRGPKP